MVLQIIIKVLFSFNALVHSQDLSDLTDLRKPQMPVVEGDTLYISGVIDSHIYDFLARGTEYLKPVKKVSLNSFGGNSNWAIDIGRKINELGFNTIVQKGNYCASACIYLLGSGVHRSAHESTWLGVHGARLGKGAFISIASVCFEGGETESIRLISLEQSECEKTVSKWYDIAKEATDSAFDLMESSGVLSDLRTTYYSMDEVENWFEEGNVLRIKDWVLSPQEALGYLLIHDVITD